MPSYQAPLDDMRFVLNEVLDVGQLAKFKAFESADTSTLNEFLALGAQVAQEILHPLNASGDAEGCVYDKNAKTVKTPRGFKEAYKQFCEAGFPAISCDPAYGGMGMPITLNTAIGEMLCSANMSFAMYPGLSHGAYNALAEYGTDELKQQYLPKLVTGEWTGTMCLTEPHCGTDLGLCKTKAVKQADSSYKITGTKIFISAGEHDLADNICHLVLARIDDPSTPEGIKGISLFIVPKINPDGSRNGAFCGRIEEKMGIHANSTCEMQFEAAAGHLVGEAHKGMRAMFVMMNEARLGVGLQGLGLSEVAYQNALIYALDRIQSAPIDAKKEAAGKSVAIINHPDVRRELLTIKANVESERALAYWISMQLDISHHHPDEAARAEAKKFVDLLTPVIKAICTDHAVDSTNGAMQVFGGHGYIREHGMEQFNRDARITRIYEGTNGIQALDLIGRKVMQQNLLPHYLKQVEADLKAAKRNGAPAEMIDATREAANMLRKATRRLQWRAATETVKNRVGLKGDLNGVLRDAAAMSTDYLKLTGLVAQGHMWVKMADVASQRLREPNVDNRDFYETKLQTAQFFFDKLMPQVHTLTRTMQSGAKPLMSIAAEKFAHTQSTVGEKSRIDNAPPAKSKRVAGFFGW